jgi:AraC-like DNA-binding protein
MIEAIISSNHIEKECVSADCAVCRLAEIPEKCESAVYTAFHGIAVVYNDFHTGECKSNLNYTEKMISIDHCAEGRIEWEHDDGSFCYLGERDVQISVKTDHVNAYRFPTNHYHGITVNIFIERAAVDLKKFFPLFTVDLTELWKRYSSKKDFFVLRSEKTMQDIFSDLYQNKENIQMDYLRIKVMELLMALCKMKSTDTLTDKPYFKRSHVEKVKAVKEYLCEHTDNKITLQGLAVQFAIPAAILKDCFKAMYGQSLYAFIKQFRLQKAAHLLKTTEQSITYIAGEIGYENPSKFTAAFKNRFTVTPFQYRKKFNKTDCFEGFME